MKRNFFLTLTMILLLTTAGFFVSAQNTGSRDALFVFYQTDRKQNIKMYWKDEEGRIFGSLLNLKNRLQKQNQALVFAMNGGMYKADHSPLGLYIENGKRLAKLNTFHGEGNFYLQPNGVFYITNDNKAAICPTQKFVHKTDIQYATQSEPMLVVNGVINPVCKSGSVNVNIRNGVGILPDGQVVFAMSKTEVNFYDFADFF